MATKRAYKIMPLENGKLVSGANKDLGEFDLSVGAKIRMPGKGIYMSTNREFVLESYSGLADEEVLLTLEFNPQMITSANMTDKEPEITVPAAVIRDIEYLVEGELQPRKRSKAAPEFTM